MKILGGGKKNRKYLLFQSLDAELEMYLGRCPQDLTGFSWESKIMQIYEHTSIFQF